MFGTSKTKIILSEKYICYACIFGPLEKCVYGLNGLRFKCSHKTINQIVFYSSPIDVLISILSLCVSAYSFNYYVDKIFHDSYNDLHPSFLLISICGFVPFYFCLKKKEKYLAIKMFSDIMENSFLYGINCLLHYKEIKSFIAKARISSISLLIYMTFIVTSFLVIYIYYFKFEIFGSSTKIFCLYFLLSFLFILYTLCCTVKAIYKNYEVEIVRIFNEKLDLQNVKPFDFELKVKKFKLLYSALKLTVFAFVDYFKDVAFFSIILLTPTMTFTLVHILNLMFRWNSIDLTSLIGNAFYLIELLTLIIFYFFVLQKMGYFEFQVSRDF